ncbi:glycosyltransferase [Deinococcus sp. QL22]|uniref:glycosyltransferase n=1 Tax=Deinococcus sp. QL22 TaxID=2939437 RepID=UPI002016C2B4|nr:glycosyltransferase [Deinococcus sp. QL22]UQN10091.1 glycosyltransferase [Deinococcus sp. QL22]
MTRAAQNQQVYYVEEPIFGDQGESMALRKDQSGVMVCTPHVTHGLSADESQKRTAKLLQELVRNEGLTDYVLWVYTPMELPITAGLSPALTVYDCMDELANFRHAPPELLTREAELFRRADLVFTGGYRLWEAKRHKHPRVFPFPSSVDVPHFARARTVNAEPEDQAGLVGPRLGFYGVLDERFDAALVSELAERRPDWTFVLLGPVVKVSREELPQASNVHYLGQKCYGDLPAYLSGWDVALLPFARNDSTEFISPTKTPEYLAAGVPVVSTAIHDVVRPYGEQDLLEIAHDAAGFEAAIQKLLDARGTAQAAERQTRADSYLGQLSWDKTWQGMQVQMAEAATNRTTLVVEAADD